MSSRRAVATRTVRRVAVCLGVATAASVLAIRLTGQTTSTSPTAPTGLAVMTDSFGGVWLAWDVPPSGQRLSGYFLEAGSASGLTDLGTLARFSLEPSFTTANVPAGTYYLRVRAVNADALSPPSNEVRLVVRPTADDPGAPDIPLWSQFAIQGSTAILSLRLQPGSAPATSYIVAAGSWPGMNDLGELVTRDTSWTVPNVPSGVYYIDKYGRNDRGTRRVTSPLGVIVTPSCSYVVGSTMVADLGRVGGSGAFIIRTSAPECSWVAATDRTWFFMDVTGPSLNPVSGTGDGEFGVRAPPNFGSTRVGLIKSRGAGREIAIFLKQRNFFEY